MLPDPSSIDQNIGAIRQLLQESLGNRRYQNWFGGTTKLELEGSELTIHVQGPYLVKWIQQQFGDELQRILLQVLGPAAEVRFEVGQEVRLSEIPEASAAEAQPVEALSRTTAQPHVAKKRKRGGRPRPLSDFVTGPSNELAVAAIHQLVHEPDSVAMLYLHSNVGNGKSHLLEATRLQLRKEDPQLKILSLTAEQFTNYFTQALSAKTLPSFRQKFRSADVLLIDDVDFLDGKKGIQDEFLHTLKQFESENRQVVVTSNRHPRLLGRTSEELVSRFVSGLVFRLEKPETETRQEIVRRHAIRQGAKFSEPVVEYIASRFLNNGRDLEGAVNILATWARMEKKTVTVSLAKRLLNRLERDCMKMIRIADIETAICTLFGIEEETLKSKTRKQSVSQPRMLAMYLSRTLTDAPYSEIGEYFGGRNHSTVMSAQKKVSEQLKLQETIRVASETWELKDLIDTLKDRIQAG
ncbi:Chromosomal replication initiator protein DnaA [Thalassoglobus polymorphus]|uniref:Chromosomal replication initiator protein DnaA n=2 Tax=Thalassoglobus polymorphus TaxID=2527994 RepID=A0A517QV31_9PLAN|nr:Chromosomal replication initiator protein DnaA [Thalassoglobus polymorphus]